MTIDSWVNETLYPDWGQRFRVKRELARVQSDFQDIMIFESYSHGRVMLLDGVTQITEMDEFVYQEMLTHVPLLAHGDARRVLIIGAGDGGVLKRVLQQRNVEKAVMVEIDGEVIRLVKEFLPEIAGDAWNDPRAEVIVGDGIDYVRKAAAGSFDVVIVDSTDPVGVGEVLFTDEFSPDRIGGALEGHLVAPPYYDPKKDENLGSFKSKSADKSLADLLVPEVCVSEKVAANTKVPVDARVWHDDGRSTLDVTLGDDKARPVRESLRHERHTVDGESGDRDERATRLRGPRIRGDGVDAVDTVGDRRAEDRLEFCAAHKHRPRLTTGDLAPPSPRGGCVPGWSCTVCELRPGV